MNPRSLRRLEAMGIRTWRLRAAAAPETSAQADDPLIELSRCENPLATMVVDWHGPFELDHSHAAGELLLNIAAAVHSSTRRLSFYQSNRVAPLPGDGQTPVFWFTDETEIPRGVVALPSLAKMINDPAFKRQAWKILKPWSERLK